VKRARSANTVTTIFFLSLYDFLKRLTERFSAGGFSVSACRQKLTAGGNLCRGHKL
jgi:hypothetical protein